MAEDKDKKAEGAATAEGKKKLPLKTIIVLAVVLLVEGAVISLVFLLSSGPAPVQANVAADDAAAKAEEPVELLIVSDSFQNTRSGRTYIYETEVWVVVRRKHDETVKKSIEQMSAQLTSDIATIFRKAEPSYLLDPNLATLTRQIKASVDERLGKDADGKPVADSVLIKKFMQYRADI